MKKVCRNCKWWRHFKSPTEGHCHLKPPMGSSWPKVNEDDFCSEFEFNDKADGEREITGAAFNGRGLS